MYELNISGLVDFLWDSLSPEAIILYGSHARGESIEGSDVDIFIIGKEHKISVKPFKKKIKKEIHLMFSEIAQDEVVLMDDLRIKRNKSSYEGKKNRANIFTQ